MALSRVVSEIFNVEKCCDLEIGVRGQSRSLKVVPFDRLDMISYYCSLVTLSVRRTVFFIYSSSTYAVTLGSLKVIENYTIRSGTHDFLLTFHSYHRPISRRFRDKRRFQRVFSRKSPNFPTPVYL